MRRILLVLGLLLGACEPRADSGGDVAMTPGWQVPQVPVAADGARVRTAGFVVTPQVFNSELMAPYDVFQHSVFRDSLDFIQTFVVSEDGAPVETFEGILVTPHFSFETAPDIDILVIPSTGESMGADLENAAYLNWLESAVERAEWVITVCDGAFPLAAIGALDGRSATTFPADRQALQDRFPAVNVSFEHRIVVDGKFITSVGGAMSYEPAFWLVEHLYGRQHAVLTAEGLVWPWDVDRVPVLAAGS